VNKIILFLFWLGLCAPVLAQTPPVFPQTMPPNTIMGRLGITSGPAEAIPLSNLYQNLNVPGTTLDVTTYGVVPNTSAAYSATLAAENSAPLVSAIATGQCVRFPYNVNGYSIPSNVLVINTTQCILNPNMVTLYAQPSSNQFVFRIIAQASTVGPAIIAGVHVDTTGASAGSTVFRFGTTSFSVQGVRMEHDMCTNAYTCLGDEGSMTYGVLELTVQDLQCIQTLGTQISFTNSEGFMWFDNVLIDETGNASPPSWIDILFNVFAGVELHRVTVQGPTVGDPVCGSGGVNCPYNSSHVSLYMENGLAVWLDRVLIDSTQGDGVIFLNVSDVELNWIEASGALGNELILDNVSLGNISNVFGFGNKGNARAPSGANGISCNGCADLNFSNLYLSNMTGDGMLVGSNTGFGGDTVRINITNLDAVGNGGIALAFVTPSESIVGVQVTNFIADGNTSSALFVDSNVAQLTVKNGTWATNGGTVTYLPASPAGNVIEDIAGYNPVGTSGPTTVGTSPATICAGSTHETHYYNQSATNTAALSIGGIEVGALGYANMYQAVELSANQCVVVTWLTTAPTYTKVIH